MRSHLILQITGRPIVPGAWQRSNLFLLLLRGGLDILVLSQDPALCSTLLLRTQLHS